ASRRRWRAGACRAARLARRPSRCLGGGSRWQPCPACPEARAGRVAHPGAACTVSRRANPGLDHPRLAQCGAALLVEPEQLTVDLLVVLPEVGTQPADHRRFLAEARHDAREGDLAQVALAVADRVHLDHPALPEMRIVTDALGVVDRARG